ncbi:MAG: restriction endonuclease [bacterium]|nr:restriction endonuclease [bacterium]
MESLQVAFVADQIAHLLYDFLPGNANLRWGKAYRCFENIATECGLGNYWIGGSKEKAISELMFRTLVNERGTFEKLLISVVRNGITYRKKQNKPVTKQEIELLNGLLLKVQFKFPELWDSGFLFSLEEGLDSVKEDYLKEKRKDELLTVDVSLKIHEFNQIKDQYYGIMNMENRQKAGKEFEIVLNGLFEHSGLSPRKAFRVVGEEIDGSLEFEKEIYLIEAKWEKYPLSEAPLSNFREKVTGKSLFTRGIFISYNGFTSNAVDALTRGKQPIFFLVDGQDLHYVFENKIELKELLSKKLRLLCEEGKVFVRAIDLL